MALIYLLGGSLLTPALRVTAESNENTYDSIAGKNVFRLKPIIIQPIENTAPVEPPSKVTLTGITDIFGAPLAIMEVQPPNKPKLYLTLSEGQRESDIEVVSINQKAGTVTLKNQGIQQTVDMKDAEKRAASAPAPVMAAGSVAGRPGMMPPAPSAAANNNNNNSVGASIPNADFRSRSIPNTHRELRTATSSDFTGGAVSSRGRSVSVEGSQQSPSSNPEEQIGLLLVNKALNEDKVARKQLPPLPPLPFGNQ